jgi:hypothetical protein
MSTEPDAVNRLLDQYEHRSPETVEGDLDAPQILDRYLEHEEVDGYHTIESDFPYQALLGRSSDADAEVTFTAHYTYLLENDLVADSRGVRVAAEDMEEVIREVLPEEKVIDIAGVEIEEDKRSETPSGDVIQPGSLHCVVFYDEPVPTEDMMAQGRMEGGLMHRKTLEEAASEPSLGTALVTTGRTPEGDFKAGMQVDYWTRFIDDLEGGLDYTELDWENPAGEL